MRFAKAAPWGFVAGNAAGVAAVLAAVLFFVPPQGTWGGAPAYWTLVVVGVAGVGWVVLLVMFFRDPERSAGEGVVSPADGRVTAAAVGPAGARVTVVLGVLNVHVVRAPAAGRLVSATHRKGARRLASSKEAAENERLELVFEGTGPAEGATVRLTMIAGAFADRIVSYLKEGEAVEKGGRVGIIKFGSRVDMAYEPAGGLRLAVKEGVTVKGALTPLLLPAGKGEDR